MRNKPGPQAPAPAGAFLLCPHGGLSVPMLRGLGAGLWGSLLPRSSPRPDGEVFPFFFLGNFRERGPQRARGTWQWLSLCPLTPGREGGTIDKTGKGGAAVKRLIFVNGTMGAGKTATCRELKKLLPPCAFLDGDWCWDMEPLPGDGRDQGHGPGEHRLFAGAVSALPRL